MTSYAQVQVGLERLPQGPWIYARLMDERGSHGAEDGSIVEVIDGAGRFCGHGLYNSSSDIRVRMLSRGRRSDLDRPREFLRRRIAAALRLRRRTLRLEEVTDAFRVVHAEGDDLSGLIVDKLGDALVCQYHSLGFWGLQEDVEAILRELLPATSCSTGSPGRPAAARARPGSGPVGGRQADPRYVQEHGVRFLVHPGASHKTGWFCDQRDNRRHLAALARGRHVMDLCCHAGGFSIPAALAGARSVTAADLDEEPLGRAERAAAENAADVTFHHADAFDVLRATVDSKRRPGLLILDPHKLAKGKRDLEAAKVKYRDLNALGIAAAAPGGILATFSCSGALDLPAFAGVVFQAARRAEREVRLLETLGAGPRPSAAPGLRPLQLPQGPRPRRRLRPRTIRRNPTRTVDPPTPFMHTLRSASVTDVSEAFSSPRSRATSALSAPPPDPMTLPLLVTKDMWQEFDDAWAELRSSGGPIDELLPALKLAGEKKRAGRLVPQAREHADALVGAGRAADAALILGATLVAGGNPGEINEDLVKASDAAWSDEEWYPIYREVTGFVEGASDLRKPWKKFAKLIAFTEGSVCSTRAAGARDASPRRARRTTSSR